MPQIHQPLHAAEYAYLAETYRPDPEDERIDRIVEESARMEAEEVAE